MQFLWVYIVVSREAEVFLFIEQVLIIVREPHGKTENNMHTIHKLIN